MKFVITNLRPDITKKIFIGKCSYPDRAYPEYLIVASGDSNEERKGLGFIFDCCKMTICDDEFFTFDIAVCHREALLKNFDGLVAQKITKNSPWHFFEI